MLGLSLHLSFFEDTIFVNADRNSLDLVRKLLFS